MIKNKYPGKFIVLEGLDGSGKTAQGDLLSDYLKESGKSFLRTKEPTIDSEAGRKIKQALRGEISLDRMDLQQLFVQDRLEHLENQIIPALKDGKIVFCERYIFSTVAYGAGEGLDIDLLAKMNDNFLLPDLTIILRVSTDSCMKRIEGRGTVKELFEKKEKLERVSAVYDNFPKMYENVAIIDSEGQIAEVFEKIKEIIRPII